MRVAEVLSAGSSEEEAVLSWPSPSISPYRDPRHVPSHCPSSPPPSASAHQSMAFLYLPDAKLALTTPHPPLPTADARALQGKDALTVKKLRSVGLSCTTGQPSSELRPISRTYPPLGWFSILSKCHAESSTPVPSVPQRLTWLTCPSLLPSL